MFPTELQIAEHRNEMVRAAQRHYFVKTMRTEPTLWQSLVARLSSAVNSRSSSPKQDQQIQRAAMNIVATDR